MPIYTYRCENCSTQFDIRQSFSDEPLAVCPECKQSTLRKVITPAGIVFKGSGWYVNDHKSKSSAAKPAKTGTESKSESKESSTPASTSSESTSSTSTPAESIAAKSSTSE